MPDIPTARSMLRAAGRKLRIHMITIPHTAKQVIMLSADAVGLFSCVLLATWLLIPDFNDLITSKARVDDIREVNVEVLLGRDIVSPDGSLLSATISGKTDMVTGAGGFIGSELSGQILQLQPKRIVLFELSEAVLYRIEKNLRELSSRLGIHCDVIAFLGLVHHQDRAREVMQAFEVNTVYHATTRRVSHGGMTQTNESPEFPGRFRI